jgi:hypothetical protein
MLPRKRKCMSNLFNDNMRFFAFFIAYSNSTEFLDRGDNRYNKM